MPVATEISGWLIPIHQPPSSPPRAHQIFSSKPSRYFGSLLHKAAAHHKTLASAPPLLNPSPHSPFPIPPSPAVSSQLALQRF
ncbi:hypothetical protein VPH35_062283 [Triticum aestivum]